MTCAIISHADCLLHDMGSGHPECPERVSVINKALKNASFVKQLKFCDALPASRENLVYAHSLGYIDNIFALSPKTGKARLDPDTSMNPYTLNAALLAAGAMVQSVDLVMRNKIKSVFCNIRPPGHHAEHNRAMGFCFFNNVAVGVMHALHNYELERIAIVDFDVHHGNGTQDIFQNESRVLYCSSFQYPLYPYSDPFSSVDSQVKHIINIPLSAGTQGEQFRKEVEKCWLQQIRDFNPQLLFISTGFDAHQNDPLAQLLLKEDDYTWITTELKKIADACCQGRIISALEGGYALDILGQCAIAHVRALL